MASSINNGSDALFGPAYHGPSRSFDFTLLFEDTILTIVPSALFLLAAGTRAAWLVNSPNKVTSSLSRSTKLALLSAYAAVQLTFLLARATDRTIRTSASVAAAALDFTSACALLILSIFEHSRSVTPSTIIGLYLLITLPFDAARLRTFYLLDQPQARGIANVLAVAAALKVAVLLGEATEKRSILLHPYRDLPPEATSGIYNKSVLWWVNPLLKIGFGRTLRVNDLFDLDQRLSSADLNRRFTQRWSSVKGTSRHTLLYSTFAVVKWQLVTAAIPRLLFSAVRYAQPFLIQDTIDFVARPEEPAATGWGLAGAYFLIYAAQAIFQAASLHMLNRVATQIRGGLVALLYSKTLDVSTATTDPVSALTLMSTDVQRVVEQVPRLHDAWVSFIDVGVAIYLLYDRLGNACYGPAAVYVVLILATAWASKVIGKYQRRWIEAVELRVSFTSALLQSMRNVKLLGLSSVMEQQTQGLRLDEIRECKRYRRIQIAVVLLQNGPSVFPPFVTFLIYFLRAKGRSQPIDIANAFSILAILRLVEIPLNALINSAPQLAASISCFERIQEYLQAPARNDNRLSTQDVYDSDDYWRMSSEQHSSLEMRNLSVSRSPAAEAVALKQCSFGWKEGDDGMVVHDVDLVATEGTTTMVIGPVGCGKTTLLMGMLGETPQSRGFVYLRNPSVAFAGQEAWIPNGTIKAAIQGASVGEMSSETESWYEEVITSCGLASDFAALSNGDQTVIGTKGVSLSGGQKQRIALARALYGKCDLLVLDDIFSGLDNETEELIFRKLFAKAGPVKRMKTTVVMVTHAVHRLPYADHIICLDIRGVVSDQGSYADLVGKPGGYIHSLNVRFKEQNHQLDEGATDDVTDKAVSKQAKVVPGDLNNQDDEQRDLLRRTGEFATYQHFFRSAGYVSSILSVVWALIWIVSTQMPGILVRAFSDGGAVSTSSSRAIMFITGFGISCVTATLAVLLLAWQVFMDMQPRYGSGLHLHLLQTVLRAPLYFFTRTDTGSILNRFSQDMALVDADLLYSYVDFILSFVAVMTGLGLMLASGAGYFAAAMPFTIAALYGVQKYYLRTSRQLRLLDLEEKAPLYTLFGETASGLTTIRAFGWTNHYGQHHLALLDRSQRPFYLMFCIQRWLGIVLDFLVTALVTVLMMIVVLRRDSLTPATVGLGLLSVVTLNWSLNGLVQTWTTLETSIGAITRLRDFHRNTENEHLSHEKEAVRKQWPENGEVALADFNASYSEHSDLVLRKVGLTIKAGEKVGICGRSGSGKSSLLASLFHLLEFRDGKVEIDGIDLASIPRECLRSRLNVIPQEPWWITTESVRFNMDPWNATSSLTPTDRDAMFVSALRRCQIWAVIDAKGGLDALMKADFLSHGQRQLFCLARAIVRRSQLVVLDEVSANVDVKTDELMQSVIRECFAPCTIIAVAHRLDTIIDFDRVVVLRGGNIVEVGVPGELLKVEGGWFKDLYEA